MLGKPKRKLKDNIKIHSKEIVLTILDWAYMAQDMEQRRSLENIAINLRVRYKTGNFLSNCATGSSLRRFLLHKFDLSQWINFANYVKADIYILF